MLTVGQALRLSTPTRETNAPAIRLKLVGSGRSPAERRGLNGGPFPPSCPVAKRAAGLAATDTSLGNRAASLLHPTRLFAFAAGRLVPSGRCSASDRSPTDVRAQLRATRIRLLRASRAGACVEMLRGESASARGRAASRGQRFPARSRGLNAGSRLRLRLAYRGFSKKAWPCSHSSSSAAGIPSRYDG